MIVNGFVALGFVGGLAVAPGFIDVHTHDDWAVLQSPAMECKITQGLTTVIAGNCGISAAPFTPRNGLPAPFGIVPGIAEHSFGSVEQYAKAVDLVAPAVNVMLLAGHSSLRVEVMGRDSDRASNGDEIAQIAVLLDQALAQCACVLSSGLDVYPYAGCSRALIERFVSSVREINMIWSEPHLEKAICMLDKFAIDWG